MQFCLAGAVVAAAAGVVAVDDQSEQSFDAWSGALEVLALDRVGKLAQCGLAEVFAAAEADLALAAGRAACSQRAGLAVAAGEARNASAVGDRPAAAELVDGCRVTLRAGDRLGLEIDGEAVLVQDLLLDRSGGVQGREHADGALLESLADLDVAVGGITDDLCWAPPLGLLLDQRGGVMPVVLVPGEIVIAVSTGALAAAATCSL